MPKKTEHIVLDNLSQLRALKQPLTTRTYKAIPHHTVYEKVMDQARKEGYEHLRDTLEVTHGGERAFLNMQFQTDDPTLPFSVAVRSTYDRSASLGIATGASVFICSNLMISGSDVTIMRAHKGSVQEDLEDMIERAFNGGKQSYKDKIAWRENLMGTQLTERQGRYLLAMAQIESSLFNRTAYNTAVEHWIDAPYTEFQGDRSLWGLYNAMTFGAHKVRPSDKMDVHKQLVSFTENILVEDNKLVIA